MDTPVDKELLKEFLVECYEGLENLTQDLIKLERQPSDSELLAGIFRYIHTIKGSCGFLGIGNLEVLSHAGEGLLADLRDGKLQYSQTIASQLLVLVDAIREILGCLEESGQEGENDYAELIDELCRLKEPSGSSGTKKSGGAKRVKSTSSPRSPTKPAATQDPVSSAANKRASSETDKQPAASALAESTIRVNVELLDELMNLIGELVLTRHQIMQSGVLNQDSSLSASAKRLNRVTTQLHESFLKTRMLPVDRLWKSFPRVVRDLAIDCGKQARIEFEGGDTELDRSLIEALKDPLTHLLRNAVDHGIELPDERLARGKSAEGLLRLCATHRGGQINISISDDGGGIEPDKMRQKAVEQGILQAKQAEKLSDEEALQLIFRGGFSTAEKLSKVSGRGVGMDVVKTNIKSIGGYIDLDSRVGAGTTIEIRIPLTLAIIQALIVRCGDQRFAIPQNYLSELVEVKQGKGAHGIEKIHGAPVYRLRNSLLPLILLSDILQIKADGSTPYIAVLQLGEDNFGLVVDEIIDSQEIVVKPVSEYTRRIPVFAGCTIMGDGQVALILDVTGIAQQSGVLKHAQKLASGTHSETGDATEKAGRLMLVQAHGGGRMAIPLSRVQRIEEISMNSVEKVGEQDVVQIRGDVIPLINISGVLPERRGKSRKETGEDEEQILQVVICADQGRLAGLVPGLVLDIVTESYEKKLAPSREGVQFTAVIDEHVHEVLDVSVIIRNASPVFFEPLLEKKAGGKS